MDTPHLDEFMKLYNLVVGTSNMAIVLFYEVCATTAKRRSATRWFSTNDVQELSLLPNALNGNLLKWIDRMVAQGVCDKMAPKMRAFLLHTNGFVTDFVGSRIREFTSDSPYP